jgi:hypothetical protein
MKVKIRLLMSIIAIMAISSCASIVSKSSYPVMINSDPSESSISITNSKGMEVYKGNTPATVVLKSSEGFFEKASYQVKFTKEGYQEKIVPIYCKVDGWYWGNLVFGGIIGFLIVDPATGAMYKLEREFLNERLTPSPSVDKQPQLKIYELSRIPSEWKDHLVLLKK